MPKSKPSLSTPPGEVTNSDKPKRVSIFIKIFLFFHVIAITSWSLPKPATGVMNGNVPATFPSEWLLYVNETYVKHSVIQPYMLSTGMWQAWDMFSPNPANADIYGDEDVVFKNGKVVTYHYPRMYTLGLVEKYRMERYRKFFEHAGSDQDPYLYPIFAKRVMFLTPHDASNPIVKVLLKRHWYDIPKPLTFEQYSQNLWDSILKGKISSDTVFPPSPQVPDTYNSYTYYTYNVPPGEGA